MNNILKQGTIQTIHLGPFVDDTDGATLEEGLTIIAANIKISKNGATFASSTATAISHDVNGEYSVTLSVADTNTVGILRISCKKVGALVVPENYFVVSVDNYNAAVINSGALKVDLNSIGTFGLTSGDWELEGKRLHLINTDASGIALLAQSTGTTSTGFKAEGTTNDILASELISIEGDTSSIVAVLPASGLIASQDSVDNIENNTRLSIGVSPAWLIPETGDTMVRIKCFLKDEGGNPEDPDSDEISLQTRADNGAVYKTALFDDEAGSTGATASSTFTPSYFKMFKLSQGSYEIWYKLPSTEVQDRWSLVVSYEEAGIRNNLARGVSIDASVTGGTILADNATNHTIIAKSLKNNNVSAIPDVTGSVYKDLIDPQTAIFNKLPSGNISDYSNSTIVTGSITVGDVNKYSKAMFNGRVKKNFPNPGQFTLYDHDNVTVLSVMNSTVLERTRVS